MPWVPSRGSCCVGRGLRADPGGPGWEQGKRMEWAQCQVWGRELLWGATVSSALSPPVPLSLPRCREEEERTCWGEQGPQPTLGSHPAPAQLGTKASLLGQQTPLCPSSRRKGPRQSLTPPLPEAPELQLCYLREGARLLRTGGGNEGGRWAGLEEGRTGEGEEGKAGQEVRLKDVSRVAAQRACTPNQILPSHHRYLLLIRTPPPQRSGLPSRSPRLQPFF